jgi:hypothetical protein
LPSTLKKTHRCGSVHIFPLLQEKSKEREMNKKDEMKKKNEASAQW